MSIRTEQPRLRKLIDALAEFYGLPRFAYKGEEYSAGELLEGLVLAESSGDPQARRYEAHQDRIGRTDAPTDPDTPGRDDGDVEDDASYGLTQVMGYNWRAILGLKVGTPITFAAFAFDVTFALRAGIRIFKDALASAAIAHPGAVEGELVVRALCRYNGGPTGDALVDVGGGHQDLRLRAYVDLVHSRCQLVRASRQAVRWV